MMDSILYIFLDHELDVQVLLISIIVVYIPAILVITFLRVVSPVNTKYVKLILQLILWLVNLP